VKSGERVVIVKSWHCDIGPGTEGMVVKRRRRGYEIEIIAIFSDAFGKKALEKRVAFFSANELRRANSTRS
jgi:hypothetical protein